MNLNLGFFGTIILALDIIAIASVVMGTSSTMRKTFWVVIILLFPFLGVILYYFLGRSRQDM